MARGRISRELVVAVLASVGLHAVWLVREAKASSRQSSISEVSLEAVLPPPKAEPPKTEPPPAPSNAPPEPVARTTAVRAQATAAQALPAAAQAGKTLTAPDNGEKSELADFTMVQGEGTAYVGGTTSSRGTSRIAVSGPASPAPAPAPSPVGTAKTDLGPDRSRSAMPSVAAWDCSRLFPTDSEAGDYATVLIAVTVGVDGLPKRVAMLRDPGHGFGAAALQCAMGQRYNVALDKTGAKVEATTPPIVVRFSR